jgi:uncharacterized protein (TIRG00374 family)
MSPRRGRQPASLPGLATSDRLSGIKAEARRARPGAGVPRALRRAWRIGRFVIGLGLGVAALWAVGLKRGELVGAGSYLARCSAPWTLLAALLEVGSMVAFGLMQRRLLAGAGVAMGRLRAAALSYAETALANSLPGGPAISAAFGFRQLRVLGASEAVAVWGLAATFVAAAASLAAFVAVGVGIAGAEGAAFGLVGVSVVVVVLAFGAAALFAEHRALAWALRRAAGVLRCAWPRRGRAFAAKVEQTLERLAAVQVAPVVLLRAASLGLANWVADCGCLACSYLAVGAAVPWRGLLLSYGAAQLAVNLPVTPGGLGVVEGSLTIALVAFGGVRTSTVAAVLLYRIMSFWAGLPIGWACAGGLALRARRSPAPAVGATVASTAPRPSTVPRSSTTPRGAPGLQAAPRGGAETLGS